MALDRTDTLTAVNDLFEADSTLMGLLDTVSIDEVKYLKAPASVANQYRLYLTSIQRETVQDRSQNKDFMFRIDYTINGKASDPQTAKNRIDDIEERMDYLISNEMWTGNNLTSDSDSIVYDMNFESGEAEIRDEEELVVVSEGIINVFINQTK